MCQCNMGAPFVKSSINKCGSNRKPLLFVNLALKKRCQITLQDA